MARFPVSEDSVSISSHYPSFIYVSRNGTGQAAAAGYYGAVFDDEITDFYSWTIPKEDRIILGSALAPRGDVLRRFDLLKTRLKEYGFDFGERLARNGAYLYRPVRGSHICTGGGRIALVGEAAGYISPSSEEGISYAFRSSLALARALDQGIEDIRTDTWKICSR